MHTVKISSLLVENLIRRARLNARLRSHHNFHSDYADSVQRLANSIDINSYIRPHRHLLDPRSECLIALRGSFALVVFDGQGIIIDVIKFGSENYMRDSSNYGVNISPTVWHTVVALRSESVLFEVKSGPFDPLRAKELSSWSPAEGSPEAGPYLENLKKSIDHF